jgi:hypothetical protein
MVLILSFPLRQASAPPSGSPTVKLTFIRGSFCISCVVEYAVATSMCVAISCACGNMLQTTHLHAHTTLPPPRLSTLGVPSPVLCLR